VRLTTDVPLSYLGARAFALTGRRHLVLAWGEPIEEALAPPCERFPRETVAYRRRWVKRCVVPPMYPERVIRSALALTLHCFEDTGAIVAALTRSIPESPGSGRTWDCRDGQAARRLLRPRRLRAPRALRGARDVHPVRARRGERVAGARPRAALPHRRRGRPRRAPVDGWLRRYRSDEFGRSDVAFVICTFWLVEALAKVGRRDEARAMMNRLAAVKSPLGLLAEDLEPATGVMWGNFPRAYSHVGVIHAAFAASPS
jgi:GH15 family glucan-1,4-alpha-glucosidase